MSAAKNGGYRNLTRFRCLGQLKLTMPQPIILKSGVQMTMAVSDSFQATYAQGGFGYVCLPWVSKFQWHAFSLFEHPTVRVLSV